MATKRGGVSIEEALATPDLGQFEGLPVIRVGITIPAAGGGLREAMAIAPRIMHKGERVLVLLDTTVEDITHAAVKDTQAWSREHKLVPTTATIVDGDVFDQVLEDHREALAEAKARATGQGTIDTAVVQAEHDDGAHTELVKGCPSCEEEQALADAGE